MITWGELADRIICLELNLSAGTMIGLSLSNSLMTSLRRVVSIRREARYKLNSYSFSYWDKNGESRGGRYNEETNDADENCKQSFLY